MIYIDPPYNTGNEGWVYNDNVNSPLIRGWLGKVVGETWSATLNLELTNCDFKCLTRFQIRCCAELVANCDLKCATTRDRFQPRTHRSLR